MQACRQVLQQATQFVWQVKLCEVATMVQSGRRLGRDCARGAELMRWQCLACVHSSSTPPYMQGTRTV